MGVLPQNVPVDGVGFPPPAPLHASTFPASGRGEVTRGYSAASDMTDAGTRLSQPSRNRFSQARSATS